MSAISVDHAVSLPPGTVAGKALLVGYVRLEGDDGRTRGPVGLGGQGAWANQDARNGVHR